MGKLFSTPLASEQVREYITREFVAQAGGEPLRLPPVEQIARHLGVSVSTTRSVIRKMAAESLLQTKAGLGTFVRKADAPMDRSLILATNLTSVVEASDTLNWSESIYVAAMRALSRQPYPTTVLPLSTPKTPTSNWMKEELLRRMEGVDLLMLFGMVDRDEVHQTYRKAGKPVIEINPSHLNATANFVSTDFYEAGRRVGEAWKRSKRQRVLFLSGEQGRPSCSTELAHAGLAYSVLGSASSAAPMVLHARLTKELAENDGFQAVREVITKHRFIPDAIFCMGDYLAIGAIEALRESGLEPGEAVSVIAGTGLPSTRLTHPSLTLMLQPLRQLGETAIEQLFERFTLKNASLPGTYLKVAFSNATSTTAQENAVLAKPLF
ncbi:MAG TPA: LacI family DNA-binding transcriptional regulator [Chthoniobacteraceae bacterium]|nr:LacI family DNA-binding transcriptional regulator [Chthoniobacteraceae bacterium]